jgi:hypothetical protein
MPRRIAKKRPSSRGEKQSAREVRRHLHYLDSEEEKQEEVTEIKNSDNRDTMMMGKEYCPRHSIELDKGLLSLGSKSSNKDLRFFKAIIKKP